jgi:hypothetical protein
VVSTAGSVALKLIFEASRNTGLKVEVTSMVLLLLAGCCAAANPVAPKKQPLKRKTFMLNCFFILVNAEWSMLNVAGYTFHVAETL